MEIKKITTEVGIGYISGAEENQIRSLEPARKEFYEAFIKFSESLSGLGVANLLKKHVGFVVNKIVIGYKDGEKKSYTAYGFVKVEDYPLNVKFTTGGIPYGMFRELDECLEVLIEEAKNTYPAIVRREIYLRRQKVKWTMDKCTAVFSAMTKEELEIIDRVHENENELSEIQLLNKVNQCLLSTKNRKENLMEAAVLIIEAANKEGK